jgi:hypothetical protein
MKNSKKDVLDHNALILIFMKKICEHNFFQDFLNFKKINLEKKSQ